MTNFIVNKLGSGELIVMKRSAITSFHTKLDLSAGRTYAVFCSDGVVEKPLFKCFTIEDAEKWVFEQIELLEGKNVQTTISKEK